MMGNNMTKKDKDAKEKLMQNILHKEERRELEQVSFSFQIPISLSILTHLTRHRMHALLVPEFTPMWDLNNYVTPEKIKVAFNDIYQAAVKKNIEVAKKFKDYNNYQLKFALFLLLVVLLDLLLYIGLQKLYLLVNLLLP